MGLLATNNEMGTADEMGTTDNSRARIGRCLWQYWVFVAILGVCSSIGCLWQYWVF